MTSVLSSRNPEGTYTFASQPKVVAKRKIYRDNIEDITYNYGNLMFDRRVIRGNTYALHVLPAHAQPDPIEIQKQIERKRNAIARRRMREEMRLKSPLPLDGRLHQPVQTELYLEALTDHVEEADECCQTDDFLDRPPTPLYVPAKVGVDIMTQIYEGDLFNFDLEVIPILEVLIGKTVEQSLLEIAEEEELASIRAQQNAFEEMRQADLLEVARLAERERRLQEEKERRKAQFLAVVEQEKELAAKVAAQAFARAYLADLQTHVFNNLAEAGYFYDPVERDVEEGFLPWLVEEVDEELELWNDACLLLDGMIREVLQERHHEYRQLELMAAEMALMQEAGVALTGKTDRPTDELDMDRKSENIIESPLNNSPGEEDNDDEEQTKRDDQNDEGHLQTEAEKDETNSEINDQIGEETEEE
ncbi:Radial spoke head protein 3 like [Schistosoma japonicum]|nr:Radial spoke head protein 3 like [Schistosoma japonicum]